MSKASENYTNRCVSLMRKGQNILLNQIGLELQGFKIQSYIWKNSIVDEFNVLYLKFNNWVHITTSDETAVIEIKQEPISTQDNYPLNISKTSKDLEILLGQKLVKIDLKKDSNNLDVTVGLNLCFEHNQLFMETNQKDETTIKIL